MSGKEYKISPAVSEKLDIMRFVLIILVVLIHTLTTPQLADPGIVPEWFLNIKQGIIDELNVTVPGFFIIASVLLYRRPFTWKDNIVRKCRSLVIPFILINVFWIVFFKVASFVPQIAPLFSSSQYRIDGLIDVYNAFFGPLPLYFPFWFIRDLIVLNILASVLWYITDKVPLISLAAALAIGLSPIPLPFLVNRFALTYWIIGAVIVKTGFDLDIIDRIRPVEIAAVSAVVAVLVWLDMLHYVFAVPVFFALIYRISGHLASASGSTGLLARAAKQSFFIYAFHEFYEAMLKKAVMTAIPQSIFVQILELVIIPAVIIAICAFAGDLTQRKLPRAYSFVTGRRIR